MKDIEKLEEIIRIQIEDPATQRGDPYMRGLAAGLLTAMAIITGKEQIHRLPKAKKLIPISKEAQQYYGSPFKAAMDRPKQRD